MPDQSILVDLDAAEPVDDRELSLWARSQRVFISSVMSGMEAERSAVADAVEGLGAVPVIFERFGGRDDDPERAYLNEVRSSDIYLGILGERYGRQMASGYSATHAEYLEAARCGLRISVWVKDAQLSGPQTDFVNEIQALRTTGNYGDASDLAAAVRERLRLIASEDLSPWVKVGPLILRAQGVGHDGRELVIRARVRDEAVLSGLERMRAGTVSHGAQDVPVAWAGRFERVRQVSVTTQTRAGRGADVTLTGRAVETAPTPFADMSYNGQSPDELTEVAVKSALFGAPIDLGLMGFLVEMDLPIAAIESLRLPEDAARPLYHLLLTEALVGSGRAERLTCVEIGPARGGSRRAAVEWLPRKRYVNVDPELRRVEGEIPIHRERTRP